MKARYRASVVGPARYRIDFDIVIDPPPLTSNVLEYSIGNEFFVPPSVRIIGAGGKFGYLGRKLSFLLPSGKRGSDPRVSRSYLIVERGEGQGPLTPEDVQKFARCVIEEVARTEAVQRGKLL